MARKQNEMKRVPRACTSWLARSKDRRDGGKSTDDRERLCRPGGRVEEAPVGGPSAHHRTYRRGALAWRPFGERGVSRREGRAVPQRRPYRRVGGQACARRYYRDLETLTPHHQ